MTSRTILIVDDDDDLRTTLVEQLSLYEEFDVLQEATAGKGIAAARGGVVDHAALVEALRAGTIAGAALDVTEPEPLPRNHPLLTLPNVVIAPHLGSASDRTRRRMQEMTVENLRAGLRGEPLPYQVRPPQ